ncbi:MAG: 3-deoxy-D-manno-octulosonic acid transferase [Candidatus Aminicenantales bacterium]
MYFVYSLLLWIALVFYLPVYYVRLKLKRKESLYLTRRLGIRVPRIERGKKAIWIHAVSVGEVLSLRRLIQEMKRKHPSWEICFSTLTNAGYQVAREKIPDADHIFFIPFDFGFSVRKFFKALHPSLLVLVESEFWPHLLREAKRHSCPVLLVNGRISDRTSRKLLRFKFLARRVLQNIDRFLVQTEKDKERLEPIGIPSMRIDVSGNLKSEVHLPEVSEESIMNLKNELSVPQGKKIIVAGSIHKGEERLLLEAFTEARKQNREILLVLAPRHPEKFNELNKLFMNYQLKFQRKTAVKPGDSWDVLVLDTIGELVRFYALSDVAFIGGSLIPWGGQNLLEPAFYRKPIFFGPHMNNFAFLAEEFVRSQAARIVQNKEDLVEMFLCGDEARLRKMGERAWELLMSLQGATEETLAAIEAFVATGRE